MPRVIADAATAAEVDVFIVDDKAGKIHHEQRAMPSCDLGTIENPRASYSLTAERNKGLDCCPFCFR